MNEVGQFVYVQSAIVARIALDEDVEHFEVARAEPEPLRSHAPGGSHPLAENPGRLPESGWGLLNLKGGVVTAGKEWTDDGAVHEIHSLKRRAAKATQPVPIPPEIVRMLREHIRIFGFAPDGRLFRSAAGNYVDASAYVIQVGRAREAALTFDEHALELAK